MGEFENAAVDGAKALRISDELAVGENEAVGQNHIIPRIGVGRLNVLQGHFEAAIELLEPVIAACDREFPTYFSRISSSLGVAYARVGRSDEGLSMLRRAADQSQRIGFLYGYGLTLSQLGEVLRLKGDMQQALDFGVRALIASRQSGEQGWEAWALFQLGETYLARADWPTGDKHFREASLLADRLEMTPPRNLCLETMRCARLVPTFGSTRGSRRT